MKTRTCLLMTMVAVASLIAGIILPVSALAQNSVPGFEMLHWGMTIDEFDAAMGDYPDAQKKRKIDNGDGTWIGAVTDGAFQFGGYKFRGAAFYFDNKTGGLTSYSTSYNMRSISELLEIDENFERQYQPVSPSRRTDRESVYITYTDGTSFIHLIQFKRQRSDNYLTISITQN